ncbi:hypothetical protein E2562_013649 [Oryza meyeriana var. granulata]|uniref:Uncharacterized protein n=1 Tax=Oryza meyeriana var. granulata TaxID=110450 RepID=A0A6G1BL92_9ORYZ|nr:hypothetical protein E2562_013649 [Oryza meyeriana var. granulata]
MTGSSDEELGGSERLKGSATVVLGFSARRCRETVSSCGFLCMMGRLTSLLHIFIKEVNDIGALAAGATVLDVGSFSLLHARQAWLVAENVLTPSDKKESRVPSSPSRMEVSRGCHVGRILASSSLLMWAVKPPAGGMADYLLAALQMLPLTEPSSAFVFFLHFAGSPVWGFLLSLWRAAQAAEVGRSEVPA